MRPSTNIMWSPTTRWLGAQTLSEPRGACMRAMRVRAGGGLLGRSKGLMGKIGGGRAARKQAEEDEAAMAAAVRPPPPPARPQPPEGFYGRQLIAAGAELPG
eukprot:COSAG01_NODE_2031_length_8555_cov_4.407778_2_plen_102_part_00